MGTGFGTCGPLLSLAGVPQRRLRRQVGPRCARASPRSAGAEPASRPGREQHDDAAARLPAQLACRWRRLHHRRRTALRPAACTDHHHLHRRHRERWAMHLPGRIPVDGGGPGSRRYLRARQCGQLSWWSDNRRRRVPVQWPGHDVRAVYDLEFARGKCVPKRCPRDGPCVTGAVRPDIDAAPKLSSDERPRDCGHGMVATRHGCVPARHRSHATDTNTYFRIAPTYPGPMHD